MCFLDALPRDNCVKKIAEEPRGETAAKGAAREFFLRRPLVGRAVKAAALAKSLGGQPWKGCVPSLVREIPVLP